RPGGAGRGADRPGELRRPDRVHVLRAQPGLPGGLRGHPGAAGPGSAAAGPAGGVGVPGTVPAAYRAAGAPPVRRRAARRGAPAARGVPGGGDGRPRAAPDAGRLPAGRLPAAGDLPVAARRAAAGADQRVRRPRRPGHRGGPAGLAAAQHRADLRAAVPRRALLPARARRAGAPGGGRRGARWPPEGGLRRMWTFVGAALVLIMIPGPDQALVTRNALAAGRRAGLLTTVGGASGLTVHASAASFGVSALLLAS